MIDWKKEKDATDFYLNETKILSIPFLKGAQDTFQRLEEGVFLWQRRTDIPADHMVMEVRTHFTALHTMVPAVSYDGNPWGTDHEYKGYEKDGCAYTFAWHRTAVPGATCSWNEQAGVSLYADGSCSGSIQLREEGAVHRVIWPETEEPQVLYADCWGEPYYGKMEPRNTFRAWLCIGCGKDAVNRMLHQSWSAHYIPQTPERKGEQIWKLGVEYAQKLYTEEADGFRAFSIGFTWDGSQWVKRDQLKYEIGWCGQNASLAVSLLYDYQMNGNQKSLDMAVNVLDAWVSMARNDQGLLLARYDPEDALIDACNLGTAGQQLMEAYDQAKRLGIDKKEWMDAALGICDFVLERQQLDGRIGMSWHRDGSVCELRGSAGAFLILPLVEAFLRTGKREYHIAAARAYSCYYREFSNNSYGTSGALDTCCIDKESVIPLLKAGLLMYRSTGFDKYLDMAEDAAWYLSTWQWHHSVEYSSDTVLGSLGYDTFGGTAVSTSHHHLDPFALCYVPDLLELSHLTGKEEWKERALAIWNNASQVISDGTLQIPPTAPRPAGSCDEGYIHTRWGNQKKEERAGWGGSFGVTQWLVAWPNAFRLEVLRKCGNWNLLDGCKEDGEVQG